MWRFWSVVGSPIYLLFTFWRSGLSGCHADWCWEHPGGGPVPAALRRGLLDWRDHWRAGSWTPRPPRPHPGRPDAGLPQVRLIFTALWGTLSSFSAPHLTGNEFPFTSNTITRNSPPGAVKFGFGVHMKLFLLQMSEAHLKYCQFLLLSKKNNHKLHWRWWLSGGCNKTQNLTWQMNKKKPQKKLSPEKPHWPWNKMMHYVWARRSHWKNARFLNYSFVCNNVFFSMQCSLKAIQCSLNIRHHKQKE